MAANRGRGKEGRGGDVRSTTTKREGETEGAAIIYPSRISSQHFQRRRKEIKGGRGTYKPFSVVRK